jgi:hypothetical protein
MFLYQYKTTMVLQGAAAVHASNLPDEAYYTANKSAICKTIFNESKFGIRFAPVLFEAIKKTHPTLPYMMRSRYTGSDLIYKKLVDIPPNLVLIKQDSKYCFDLFARMGKCTELAVYYKEVCDEIINPIFNRFHYFSPTMSLVIFIGLICQMGESYSSSIYKIVWKHLAKNNYPCADLKKSIQALPAFDNVMYDDECQVWGRGSAPSDGFRVHPMN